MKTNEIVENCDADSEDECFSPGRALSIHGAVELGWHSQTKRHSNRIQQCTKLSQRFPMCKCASTLMLSRGKSPSTILSGDFVANRTAMRIRLRLCNLRPHVDNHMLFNTQWPLLQNMVCATKNMKKAPLKHYCMFMKYYFQSCVCCCNFFRCCGLSRHNRHVKTACLVPLPVHTLPRVNLVLTHSHACKSTWHAIHDNCCPFYIIFFFHDEPNNMSLLSKSIVHWNTGDSRKTHLFNCKQYNDQYQSNSCWLKWVHTRTRQHWCWEQTKH